MVGHERQLTHEARLKESHCVAVHSVEASMQENSEESRSPRAPRAAARTLRARLARHPRRPALGARAAGTASFSPSGRARAVASSRSSPSCTTPVAWDEGRDAQHGQRAAALVGSLRDAGLLASPTKRRSSSASPVAITATGGSMPTSPCKPAGTPTASTSAASESAPTRACSARRPRAIAQLIAWAYRRSVGGAGRD